MSKSSGVLKAIGYASGASVGASLGVLLVGACVFGFQLAERTEWQGRVMGLAGTVAGVAGAVVGLKLALACISHRILWRMPNSRIFSVPPTAWTVGECADADESA